MNVVIYGKENGCVSLDDNVYGRARDFVKSFDSANEKANASSLNYRMKNDQWRLPCFYLQAKRECGHDKIQGKVGIGMVVRKEGGDVVLPATLAFKGGTVLCALHLFSQVLCILPGV
ncbi:hypothetical protein ACOSP7_027022 [Xanthoceras sorbifolium]